MGNIGLKCHYEEMEAMMISSDKYKEWLDWVSQQGDYMIRVPGGLFAAVLNQCDSIVMHGGIQPSIFYDFRQHLHDAVTEKKIEKEKEKQRKEKLVDE